MFEAIFNLAAARTRSGTNVACKVLLGAHSSILNNRVRPTVDRIDHIQRDVMHDHKCRLFVVYELIKVFYGEALTMRDSVAFPHQTSQQSGEVAELNGLQSEAS